MNCPSANDSAVRASKKTIQPRDVLSALEDLEFGHFIPRCEGELAKFQAIQCDKRNTYRRKVREEAKAKQAADLANGVVENIPGPPVATIPTFSVRGRDLPPAAKRMRASGSGMGDGQGLPGGGENGEHGGVAVPVDGEEFEDDVDMNDEAVHEEDVPDDEEELHEDEDAPEGEDEEGEADPSTQLREDPLEERDGGHEEEDEVLDGEESD
jgi:DNA polymerase epsilon subunit 3